MDIFLGILTSLVILFVVPVVVYGVFSKYFKVPEPEKKLNFFLSVLVQKVGTSIGFVALYVLGGQPDWFLYSLVWVVMFAIVEVGQALAETYSKREAVAGVISEIIYFPLAGYILSLLFS